MMDTVARAGLPGPMLDNKAEEVLSKVHCTVLAVKPNGFISPVTLWRPEKTLVFRSWQHQYLVTGFFQFPCDF